MYSVTFPQWCVCVLLQPVCVEDSAPSVPSADSRMLSCSRCKRMNRRDARFCDWCGSKVRTHLRSPEDIMLANITVQLSNQSWSHLRNTFRVNTHLLTCSVSQRVNVFTALS